MNNFIKILAQSFIFIASFFLISESMANDLLKFYNLAKENDPTIHEAREAYLSQKQSLPQSISQLLPNVSGSASTTGVDTNTYEDLYGFRRYNTNSYGLTLSMPLVDYSKWLDLQNSSYSIKSAHATWTAAQQSLILRVLTLYFDILGAIDDLELAKAKRKEFNRQLEQTSQRYKVGLIAITDVHEAKARRDSAFAEEINAKNILKDKKENLSQVIGVSVDKVRMLRDIVKLSPPIPEGINTWVQKSIEQNYALEASRFNLKITKNAISKERSGHLPTLQLSGSATNSKNPPIASYPRRGFDNRIGLTLNVPIFQGGYVFSRDKQARHNYKAAQFAYEKKFRSTKSKARESYRGIITLISQVKALKQSVISNQSALKATSEAFKVGTRTITDVLNAQSALLTAKRDYSKARYRYLINSLTLKESAGILTEDDLMYIDKLLCSKTEG